MSSTPIMRYFDHRHLAEGPMRDISKEFTEFAEKLDRYLPNGPEKSTALRKLLEAKDSAVRASLDLATENQQRKRTEDTEEKPVFKGGRATHDYSHAKALEEEQNRALSVPVKSKWRSNLPNIMGY